MIYNMARGFVKAGHKVTLLAAEEFRPIESEENENFETVYFASRYTSICKPALLPYPKGLGRYLRANARRFDMILSVEVFSIPTLIAARICPEKLMIWQEMAFHQHFMGGLPAKLWYNLIGRGVLRDIPVVAQSTAARKFISRYMNHVNTSIVGHGSNSDVFFPGETVEKYFVVISMLVARKRIDRLIGKFADFVHNSGRTDYTLRIIGEGPERTNLESLTERLGIKGLVVFHGFMKHTEFAPIGRKATALLIDTQQDNNMVTIPEAIVNGTPILMNTVPTNAAFVRDNRLGIAKESWEWTDIEAMIRNYSEFHANCIAARDEFSDVGTAKKLTKLYASVKKQL